MSLMKYKLWSAAVMASSVIAADVALAQVQLEEVLVTARKRSEDLQSVPMAVSAFSGNQLQNYGVDEITDVARMTPNLQMNETSGLAGGAISVFMRGIGNDQGLSQGVGLYVDDVYVSRTGGSLFELFDVERIEILKGPQGNLYGRNTIGGAIKYITREPGEELDGDLEVKAGSDKYLRVKGAVSGPLIDNALLGGLSFSYKERDGLQDNSFAGSDDSWDAETVAIRGSLVWNPSDAVKVKLDTDYSKDSSLPPIPGRLALDEANIGTISAITTTANGIFGPGTALFNTPNDISFPSDEDDVSSAFIDGYDKYEIEQTNIALTVIWDINEQWLLKSVTAGRFLEQTLPYDFDGTEQVWINTLRSGIESDDISQELQLNFTADTINAVMGLYYLSGEQSQDSSFTLQTARLRAVQYQEKDTTKDDRELESYSAYASVDWDFMADWQLSVGARYTMDSKEEEQEATVNQGFYALAFSPLTGGFAGLPMAILPGQEATVEANPNFLGWAGNTRFLEVSRSEDTSADDDWNEFTPSARLSYNFSDDTMAYGGVSTGFKSGGFNQQSGNSDAYDPETVTTYSLGLKTSLLDNTLRINTELFYNDYKDKQLGGIQLTPEGDLVQLITNVGAVTQQGVELEVTWLTPVEGLMVNFNVGYLDSEVDEFNVANDTGGTTDLSNTTELGYSPELTGQFRATYDRALGDMGFMTLSTDISYQDDMYTNSPIDTTNPVKVAQVSEEHYIWNVIAAYRSADERWRVALEGKNLNDERVVVNTFDIGIVAAAGYNQPRNYAISVGYSF